VVIAGSFKPRNTPRSSHAPFIVVKRLSWSTLGVTARAAALMALADGKAEHSEQMGFLYFLRSRDLLKQMGRRAAVVAYEAELARKGTETEMLDAIGQQQDTQSAAVVLTAAAYVAAADGRTDVAELRLFRRMRERLGLAGHVDPELIPFDRLQQGVGANSDEVRAQLQLCSHPL
jgi:tellurite resistance protein